jgi:hypothetical protein
MKNRILEHRRAAAGVLLLAAAFAAGSALCCRKEGFDRIAYMKSKEREKGYGDLKPLEITGVGACRIERRNRAADGRVQAKRPSDDRDRLAVYYSVNTSLLYDKAAKSYVGTAKIDSLLKSNGVGYDIATASDGYSSTLRIVAQTPEDLEKIKIILGADESLAEYDLSIIDRDSYWPARFTGVFSESDFLSMDDRMSAECGVEALGKARDSAEARARVLGVRLLAPIAMTSEILRGNTLRIEVTYAVR